MIEVLVIGGGAAGIFAAIHAAERGKQVLVLEKSPRILSKVLISGGGRCNVTHRPLPPSEMVQNYPRGGKKLKGLFTQWSSAHTMKWFEDRGVQLKIEEDGRVFPVSNESRDIANALERAAFDAGVRIELRLGVKSIEVVPDNGFRVTTDKNQTLFARSVVVATGGSPTLRGFDFLANLGLKIVSPVPSLFTFPIKHKPLTANMGIAVERAIVYIPDLKQQFEGPVLVTHWGLSGPAVLKLSAFAARELAERNHHFEIRVNWLPSKTHDEVVEMWGHQRKMMNSNPPEISKRLWLYLLERNEISPEILASQLGKKNANRLAEGLLNDRYSVQGKTTYKEEFVTAGGVNLTEIDLQTFAVKRIPGLHIIGEVLDVDAITGGFNFQAAWAAGYHCGIKI